MNIVEFEATSKKSFAKKCKELEKKSLAVFFKGEFFNYSWGCIGKTHKYYARFPFILRTKI